MSKARFQLDELIVSLRTTTPSTTMVGVAVVPIIGQSAYRAECGAAIEEITERVVQAVTAVSTYRMGWFIEYFLLANTTPLRLRTLLAATVIDRDLPLETRALWLMLDGPLALEWFDETYSELAEKRDFGRLSWIDGRCIDGHLVRRTP